MQVLRPGERIDMPVSFFVDPAMLDDLEARGVTEITLSYTMYPADLPEAGARRSGRATGSRRRRPARADDRTIEGPEPMAGHKNHDYHILPPSIWPLTGAVGAILMLVGAVLWFHDGGPWLALIGLVVVLYTMWSWWADVIAEGEAGDHTPIVQIGLRYGMVLFIISEVMFFSAWFWTFFKHALYPMGDDRGRRPSCPATGRRPASRPSIPGTCR